MRVVYAASAMFLLGALGAAQAQEILHSTPAVLIKKAEPQYTPEARAARLQGTVVLSTIVDADGVPTEIKVTRGLGLGLDEKAVDCLDHWRFKPATSHGEPIPQKAIVEINFRLN
jgi:TonB family protein